MLANNPRLRSACPDRSDEPVELDGCLPLTDLDVARTTGTASNGSGNTGADRAHGQPQLDGAERREAYRPAAQDLELLERECELQALGALIDAASRGSGQLVRVEGGAGVGKTRLLAAARRHA
jgi:hypothetical protein